MQENEDRRLLRASFSYDGELGRAIRLFERLEDISIHFCEWQPPRKAEDPATTLLRAKEARICSYTIAATLSHAKTLTSLSFLGIRSIEDQALIMAFLPHTKNVKMLSLIYRFDFLLSSLDSDTLEVIDSRALWSSIGEMEKLKKLIVAYLPAKDIEDDPEWRPKDFKPMLTSFCLEEVPLSRGIAAAIFQNHSHLHSVTAGKHLIDHLVTLPQMSFPYLEDVDLSLPAIESTLEALSLFKRAPIESLAITSPKIREFLTAYSERELRHPTVNHVSVYEVNGDAENMMSLKQKEDWITQYRKEGIALEIN